MSWMDSWSRPNKHAATPPPLYLTNNDVNYCLACGRVISDRRLQQKSTTVKYCSAACRKRRLHPLDKRIDGVILGLLLGEEDSGIEKLDVKKRFRKGDQRTVIFCDEIEELVFQREAKKITTDEEEPEADSDPYDTSDAEAKDSQGNRPNPTGPGPEDKRQQGQKRAEEREMVRRAARRAVVFGFPSNQTEVATQNQLPGDQSRRKCEAVMNGQVVEPSFAKGNWAIRWRE